MQKVRAAVMAGDGSPIVIQEFDEPELEPNSALLRVALSEVCGTDVHLLHGKLKGVPYPIIPGHVSVGHIEKIRGEMLDVHGVPFQEGDRVTFLDVHRTCNTCYYCSVAKATTRCPNRKVYGITYGVEDGLTGGWAEAIYLKPGTRLVRIGDAPYEQVMAGGCSLPTALHATDRAGVGVGDTVLVLGAGPVGLSCIAFARLQGADTVLCIGAPENRIQQAIAAGADEAINFETLSFEERAAWVRGHTGGLGADITIEATGAPIAVTAAMRYTRDAGVVVVVGQYTDNGDVEFNPHFDLNRKHLDVRGCWGSDFSHFYKGVNVIVDSDRAVGWQNINTKPFGLDAINDALSEVASARITKALVCPTV